ncbi:MAG: FimB/Mfa2 family fimbrial subunit [Muribaculaceae bacterium]|nr:FimB/Mfa2 family fimbrial subunit [Muribaculaceae bacterium]
MRLFIKHFITATAAATGLTSCGVVFEELEPCPQGVEMRFTYTRNLESANAFPAQVDCLTLHIFTADGNFVQTITERSREKLGDENWRMNIALAPGRYHAIAYGGIACEAASFGHAVEPDAGFNYKDITMGLLDGQAGKQLHDHFHGSADFSIAPNSTDMTAVTLDMSKTVNHFRMLLQETGNAPIDGRDFDVVITDRNDPLDHSNSSSAAGRTDYTAYSRGQITVSDTPDGNNRASGGNMATVGFADLSTSRLLTTTDAHLIITHRESGRTVMDIPLNTYLLMGKSGREAGWSDQEYLDRCSRWTLTFFLKSDMSWSQTRIVVNGWIVKLNSTEF